ncbi:MAG: HAD hydrolase-like protein [Bacteroidales bacterium]|jgi:putative hydrolase of the HAD superfamily|nr:HAD hydrolase-like protein [Bacteroidales bacterium]
MVYAKKRAIIFDLDDTLYPQIEYTRQCLLYSSSLIAKISNRNQSEIEHILNHILENKGIEYRHIYNDLFEQISFDGMPYLKDILAKFWQCQPILQLYESTYDVLNELKGKFILALLTDGYEKTQEYKINNLQIRHFFDSILITDSLGVKNRKPSVIPYSVMLNNINIPACNCIYVGNDPNKDFVGAKQLGLKTIRINQGEYKDMKVSEKFNSEFIINSISELINCIKNRIWTDI